MKTLNEWIYWFNTEAKNAQMVDRGILDEILTAWENDLNYLIDYLDANTLKIETDKHAGDPNFREWNKKLYSNEYWFNHVFMRWEYNPDGHPNALGDRRKNDTKESK